MTVPVSSLADNMTTVPGVIQSLANQLGVAGTELYHAMVHKIVIEGYTDLMFGLILLAVTIFLGFLAYQISRDSKSEYVEPASFAVAFVAFLIGIGSLIALSSSATEIFAPEGVAAERVIAALHRSL